MAFLVTTDCCCIYCGRRHKGEVDLDRPPAKVFGYYQTPCSTCKGKTPQQLKAYLKYLSDKQKAKNKVRRKPYG